MLKYLKKIVIIMVLLSGIGLGKCYATVITDSNGDIVTDSNNDPVSDTNGPALMAPSITTQPVNMTIKPATTATFSVAATGNPMPRYQWLQEAPAASSFTAIRGATSASFTTSTATSVNSSTQYECIVSSVLGSVTSNAATLFVEEVPSIITQPVNVTITAPVAASFNLVATGIPMPTYQWQVEAPKSNAFTAISGATGASYTTPATTTAQSGARYECVVTNSIGKVTSTVVTMTVNPTPIAPTITNQPASTTVTAPARATFTVAAAGTPTLNYQWMQETPNTTSYTPIIGATSASYTTPATTASNNGATYKCMITNAGGSVVSNAALLTVNPTPIAPSITTQPASVTVTAPASATFTVAADGTPIPTYQWMQEAPNAISYTAIKGATNTWYTTPATAIANSGTKYECVITNSLGSVTSAVAILTVNPNPTVPTITTEPLSATVTAPDTATFSVVATGMPVLSYQWQIETPKSSSFTAISGATNASYTTPSTTTAESGARYECVVTNPAGSVTSAVVTLTVKQTSVAPKITTQPVSATVTIPASATFTVVATGVPTPAYQWQEELPGASGYAMISGATSASYTTPSTTTANSGTKYECVVTNSVGVATSTTATLTVNPVSVAPTITTQPVSESVTAPAKATFTVAATGIPTPTYQWLSVAPGAKSPVAIHGATSASYTTPATTTADSGTIYECVVTNAVGSVLSSTATLTVNPTLVPPSITTQPASLAVIAPAKATFTVSAVGTPTPTYQWMQEAPRASAFTAISGATSTSFTTPSTTTANSGTKYECVAANSSGKVTSSAATLTVNAVTSYVQSINYNANGQITQIQYGNGTTTAYTYNPLNFRLMRIYTSNTQAQVIQDLNYTYDSVGQVLSVTDNVNTGTASMTQTFAYDALNRLTQASGSYGSKTYAYDSIGNITQKDGLTYNYAGTNSRNNGTAAGPHAVTSLSDGSIFQYDANGNMVSLQKGTNLTKYAYDSQNRLQSVTVGGFTAASYTYDGDGGRTQKTVYRRDLALYNDNTNAMLFGSVDNPLPATKQDPAVDTTIYVGNVFESESATDGSSRQTKFIYLGDTKVASVDGSGNIFYYHTDNLGGTNVLTDATGEVREFTAYDPFGQVVAHEKYGNDFATIWYYFTGKPLDDETGLIFLGARYYNPTLGRFITPDTLVQAPSNSQTLNRYTYCNNNPVNLVDSTGHSWKSFWRSFIGAFVGALVTVFTGGLGAPIAFALGGLIGGAITGGLNGGLKGALLGGLIGGVLGGVGGYGYQLSQVAGTAFAGNAILGGLAAGSIGYTAVTGNWASFAGGLAGYGASQVAVGIGAAFTEHLQVDGNPQTASEYDVMGILQNQDKIALDALHVSNTDTAFFYQNSNGFIADIVRAGVAKFLGVSQAASDLNGFMASDSFLTSVNAHSEGTIVLADALEHSSSSFNGTSFTFNGPAILQSTAQEAVRSVGGIIPAGGYTVNGYDPIGVFTTMNPFRMAIYAGEGILTGARYHAATSYSNMGINVGEGGGG